MNSLFPDYKHRTDIQKWAAQYIGDWADHFGEATLKEFKTILNTVEFDEIKNLVYPARELRYRIFTNLQLDNIKVVIMGQDPYPKPKGQAIGYAFGCGIEMRASLAQIHNSIEKYCAYQDYHPNSDMTLGHLVEQGVFLLNSCLTVRSGKPNSHADVGWDKFIKEVVKVICQHDDDIVWMLWGENAKKYANTIQAYSNNHVLMEEHPVAASRKHQEWNCSHFYDANNLLAGAGKQQILWRIKL